MNSRIKLLRKELNLTQKDFGKQIGLKQSTINDIEHARCNITERVILSICQRFNVNEKWLRFGNDNMFNIINSNYEEFFEIFNNLSKPLQDYLIQSAKLLLDTQDKL